MIEVLKSKRSDDDLINIGNVGEDSCTVDKQIKIAYSGVDIDCGETYHLAGFESHPIIVLNRANVNKYYTLVMLDPDAPSPKNWAARSWLHWLVVNIKDANVESGFTVTEYNPPTPPEGSGMHRYVFLLIEQTKEQTHYFPILERKSFDINKYAKENKLGNVAGLSFFKTEHKKLQVPVVK